MVDCKKARLLAERLEAQIMETAQLADNKPYAEFAKRVLANGYRKALVLYLANGEKGNLSALLNMWQKRGHIKKNMDGTYSKTEAFVLKNGHYGAPVAA